MGQKCKVFRQIFYGKLYTRPEKATVFEGGRRRPLRSRLEDRYRLRLKSKGLRTELIPFAH